MAEPTAIYFTFKLLGHKRISILDGGYPDFKKQFSLYRLFFINGWREQRA